jgi:hypothetical protein
MKLGVFSFGDIHPNPVTHERSRRASECSTCWYGSP